MQELQSPESTTSLSESEERSDAERDAESSSSGPSVSAPPSCQDVASGSGSQSASARPSTASAVVGASAETASDPEDSVCIQHDRVIVNIACYSAGRKERISVLDEEGIITTYSKTADGSFTKTASTTNNYASDMAVSPTGHHMVISSTKKEESSVRVLCWPFNKEKLAHTRPAKHSLSHVTTTEDFYFYSFKSSNEVRVACSRITPAEDELDWVQGTGLSQHRAINALQQGDGGVCILVSRDCKFWIPKGDARDPVLVAVNSSGVTWKLTLEDIHESKKQFDLRSIDNDGQHFFVLNRQANCVYKVSPAGEYLGRAMHGIVGPLSLSVRVCERKRTLAVATRSSKAHQICFYEKRV